MSIFDLRLETERLVLRPPQAQDFEPWARFIADEHAARHIGGVQPRPVAWRSFAAMIGVWHLQGFGFFSVMEKATGQWVCRLGPWQPEGWPGTEVGWSIAREHWGRGFAPEGATAAMQWAFDALGWSEVIHTIAEGNLNSKSVARKLGSRYLRMGRLPEPHDAEPVEIRGAVTRTVGCAGQPMITVYGMSVSGNCHKVRMLLEHLQRPYRWVEVDSAHGATRTPDYLARNPNGKVPMLELADGRLLVESNAILFHLAEDSDYLPGDHWQRAQALSWMFFEQYSHEPYIAVARFIRGWTALDSPRRSQLPDLLERGDHALAVMDKHLQACEWFTGPRYGIADIALFAYTECAGDGGFELARYPAVSRWLGRVRDTSGFTAMPAPDAAAAARLAASSST